MKLPEWAHRAVKRLDKYKYVGLILLVGAILLAWPSGSTGTVSAELADARTEPDPFLVAELEKKLEKALSRVEGAGEVTVVLTVKETSRQVLAQDGRASEGGGQTTRETSTVLVAKGSGAQETVPLTRLGPTWQGALVVAEGGGDPRVRLALSEAVSALTGLGADKISICKGK